MNPITFNEPFELALNKLRDPARADLEAKMGRWRTSPLFVHEATVEEERDFVLNADLPNSDVSYVKWPFQVLRLALTEYPEPGSGSDLVNRTNMIACRISDEEVVVFSHYLKMGLSNGRMRQLEPIFTLSTSTPQMGDFRTIVYIKNGWAIKQLTGTESDPGETAMLNGVPLDAAREFAVSKVAAATSFMITATLPRMHMATVSPQLPPGKSVEWQKARMHYTFISHGHPANKAGIAQGSEVLSDAKEELKRLVHDRRGHWRTYRHERYRFVKGKSQWIKAIWVGPKEWIGAGGKQIYRILEPVI